MKKIITVVVMVIMMNVICAFAEPQTLSHYCEQFGVEGVAEQDGSGAIYIIMNDTLRHVIMISMDDVNGDSVDVSVYRECWSEEIYNCHNITNRNLGEFILTNIVAYLYLIEVCN